MNCPLKSIIKPLSEEISYEDYFSYCKSHLAKPERFTALKALLLGQLGLAPANVQNHGSNTCMAQISEVRPEYREHYNSDELFYFLLHKSHFYSTKELRQGKVFLPESVGDFWHLVASGKLIEEKYLSDKKTSS